MTAALRKTDRPTSSPRHHLGIDLGATNIKWVLVRDGRQTRDVVGRGQERTPRNGGATAVVERLGSLAREAIAATPSIETVGVALPGLFDAATGVARVLVNTPGDWAGTPVGRPIAAAAGVPVALINDGSAFGLAELRLGAGRGAASLVGLTLGTGVGGVVIVDGRLHEGRAGAAGEIGHQTIDLDGPLCGCGNRGCLEAFVGADRIAAACGTATAEEAVLAAQRGDRRACEGLSEIGGYIAVGIRNVVAIVAPDRVVIGGGVAAAGDLLLEPIRAAVRRDAAGLVREDEIVLGQLGTWAGAIGAAFHGAEAAQRDEAVAIAGPQRHDLERRAETSASTPAQASAQR
ncbi:MAG: ROK family protein [Chloroflexota bacterium]